MNTTTLGTQQGIITFWDSDLPRPYRGLPRPYRDRATLRIQYHDCFDGEHLTIVSSKLTQEDINNGWCWFALCEITYTLLNHLRQKELLEGKSERTP